MKRILLTGSNGFIGKNFLEELSYKYEIITISRTSSFNILKLETLMDINDIDVVVHMAAKTFVPESFDKPYSFYDFNFKSTLNIAEYARIKKVKQFIYLNSYPYGKPEYLPIDEKHKLSFHSPYNKSKYLSEELLFKYLENITNVISLRLFNVFGKYQRDSFLIPTILNQVKNSEIISIKDLKPKRDYLYVKDLISILDNLISNENVKGKFNIGSGSSYSVEEIINIIKCIIKKDFNVISMNKRRVGEVMDCYANIEKILSLTNWAPKYDLKDGLSDYILDSNIINKDL